MNQRGCFMRLLHGEQAYYVQMHLRPEAMVCFLGMLVPVLGTSCSALYIEFQLAQGIQALWSSALI